MPVPQLELVNFVIKLASNREKLKAYLADPKGEATKAGLSREQVRVLVNGSELALNDLIGADIGEWVMSFFQGAPPPLTPRAKKGKAKRRKAK